MTPAKHASGRGADAAKADGCGGVQAERGEGRIRRRAIARECRRAAPLGEAVGGEVHVSEIGEGFEGEVSGAHAVAEFSEYLRRAGAGLAGEVVCKSGEANRAAERQIVPRIGSTRTVGEIAPLRATIK